MSSKGSERSPVGENGQESTLTQNFEDVRILARGATVTLIGRISRAVLVAVTQILLARVLGKDHYGLYAVGWTFLNVGISLFPVGLQNGIIRFGSVFWGRQAARLKKIVTEGLAMSTGFGLLGAALLYLSSDFLAQNVFGDPRLVYVVRMSALTLPLGVFLRVAAATTRISQRVKYSAFSEDILRPALHLLLIVGMILVGLTIENVLLSLLVSYTAGVILVVYYVKRLFFDVQETSSSINSFWKMLLLFSLPIGTAGIFNLLLGRIDKLLVASYLTAADVGVYEAMSQSSVAFSLIIGAFNAIFSPMIARLFHATEHDRLRELYIVSTKWGVYFALPIFLVFIFVPEEIIRFVFGADFIVGKSAFMILSTAQFLNVATGAVGLLLIMTGQQIKWMIYSMLMVVLNVVLSVMLIPSFDLAGAALASGFAIAGVYILGLFEVRRTLDLWPYDRRYLKGLLSGIITFGLLWLLVQAVSAGDIVMILVLSGVSASSFFGLLYLLGLDSEDREILGFIWGRVSRMIKPGF